jgi:DNA-binding LacI/PurR family transcriptional regulator
MDNSSYSNKQITIKEVAEMAGVSMATAARVVGNYGSVSEKTRKKVMRVVEELNYIPNQLAQGIKNRSTKTVGVILGNIKNSFFGEMLDGIERCLQKAGYRMIVCNTNEDPEEEIADLRILHSQCVEGIIITTCQSSDKQFDCNEKKLYSSYLPTVFVDREIFSIKELCVKTDHFGGAYEATEYLIKKGHVKIAVFAGKDISTMQQRIMGYEAALRDNNIEIDRDLIRQEKNSDNINDTILSTKAFLSNRKDITAIFALNNLLSTGVLIALKEIPIIIPNEISFIGWDDFPLATILTPPISVVTQDMEKIATIATEKLLNMINAKENWRDAFGEMRITLKTSLVERGSCADI